MSFFFFKSSADHRDLHSFPTRRSSDLEIRARCHLVCGRPNRRKCVFVHSIGETNAVHVRSEEHTSELQSQSNLVCRLLLEKKKKIRIVVVSANQSTCYFIRRFIILVVW